MFRQLVLLVLLSSLQPGRLQEGGTDVNEMFRGLNDNIVNLNSKISSYIKRSEQFRGQIEESISSLKADLSSLNDSVSNLSMCLQEHKQQSAAELAQLQTSFQSSLEITNSKLDTLTNSTAQLSPEHQQIRTSISDMECVGTEENLQLHQNLQSNLTHQLETIQGYVEQLPVYTCGGTGGWRRVVYLDMTDPSTTCPSGWSMTGYSKRTCGRATDGIHTCDSVTFPVSGGEYSRVCGRIKAYQWGTAHAFNRYHAGHATTIDSAYVDGVIVTHASPRQHIWTFAAGVAEGNPTWSLVCPCDADHTMRIPPFVGDDYFCESGLNEPWNVHRHRTFHSSDTLWDGEDCLSSSTCCSLHDPPYFVKELPTPTTDDIETRICLRNDITWSNIAIELIDLYVQ